MIKELEKIPYFGKVEEWKKGDLESLMLEQLLQIQKPELKQKEKFFEHELEELRGHQLTQEKSLEGLGNSLMGISASQFTTNFSSFQELSSKFEATKSKCSEVKTAIQQLSKFYEPLL